MKKNLFLIFLSIIILIRLCYRFFNNNLDNEIFYLIGLAFLGVIYINILYIKKK